MDIAIVDDEKVIREQIKELILTYTPNCNLETFASGEDILAYLQQIRHIIWYFLIYRWKG